MQRTFLAGLTAIAATAAIAVPAQAQTTGPQVSTSNCKVRYSRDTGKPFTYAQCEVSVSGATAGQAVKLRYKSNLKTFNPHSEIGPFRGQTGTLALKGNETRGFQIAFNNASMAQVKKQLKITFSSPTAGVTITNPVVTGRS
ncbi:hypothetical protein DVA67_000060 [Solirubrobacter sp. CPCC 204708]|uniref:Uncharacterized protein n=1 Tax=Solirubrobacter deserti TaxID=2282478 RepID=A0ABT4RST0_9ACTN|nr:hypothetical protein [Solirubrobacter deserti]MBE2314350.1 hypothetical protein [Solirubrobacter deserti]MDA0141448.1 hypothetical protein [Solirubrobacter deserti]